MLRRFPSILHQMGRHLSCTRNVATRFANNFHQMSAQTKLAITPIHVQQRTFATQKHKKIIKAARGYRGRTNCYKIAYHRVLKARQRMFSGRKMKKRNMRSLWITRVNAGTRMYGLPYRFLIHFLNKSNVQLNRKVLADLANSEPLSFKSVIELAKSTGSQIPGQAKYFPRLR